MPDKDVGLGVQALISVVIADAYFNLLRIQILEEFHSLRFTCAHVGCGDDMQACAIILEKLPERALKNPYSGEADEGHDPVDLIRRDNVPVYLVLYREIMVTAGKEGIKGEA